MKMVNYLALGISLLLAQAAIGHDATYYNHYTNSGSSLSVTLTPNQAVYWSGANLDMEIRAYGYRTGWNTMGYPTTLPVNCYIDEQEVSTAGAAWSPYGVTPVTSRVPVLGLSEGPHTVTVRTTNTWEYLTETVFSYSSSHSSWFNTYFHYYYNVYHHVTVLCSASQPFTVSPSTNFHRIRLSASMPEPMAVLLDETFDGASGASPNAAGFSTVGEVALDGSGRAHLQTWSCNESSLRSLVSVAMPCELRLKFRASTYAEGETIYGGGQPRGLRAGTDPNNVVEFFSASGRTLGMRARRNGAETAAFFALPGGVDAMHDYEIQLTVSSAVFRLDGGVVGTLTSNIPAGALNFYTSTFDDYLGNVPATFDSVQLSGPNAETPICEVTYTGVPTNTYWLYWSWDLADWNLHSSSKSSTNGVAAWQDYVTPGKKFYRIYGP